MNPRRYQIVKRLFADAIDRPPAERRAFLEASTVGDPELLAEVTGLVEATDCADDFLRPQSPTGFTGTFGAEVSGGGTHRVHNHRLEERIGVGATGAVFRATRESDGAVFAIKILSRAAALCERLRKRFRLEAQATRRFDHPGIVRVFDYVETDEIAYLVMQWIDGADLSQEMAEAASSDPRPNDGLSGRFQREGRIHATIDVMAEIADALDYAHSEGIVHLDVKPENILVDRDGNPKLTDFGISRIRSEEEARRSPDGTPNYISPEAARGLPMDGRADVYSLGVCLYEMLAGRRPYEANTIEDARNATARITWPDIRAVQPAIDEKLAGIVRHAMELRPARRYPSAGLLAKDLRVYLDGGMPETPTAGFAGRLRRWFTR